MFNPPNPSPPISHGTSPDRQVDTTQAVMNKPLGMERMFPTAFTLITSLLLFIPTFLCIKIAHSPILTYWHDPSITWVLLAAPVLVLIAHIVHTQKGPCKLTVAVTLLLPTILLVFCSEMLASMSSHLSQELFSTDCDTFTKKRLLQRSWEEARDFYLTCLADTKAAANVSSTALVNNFRIQDCQLYPEEFAKHKKDWTYLEYLEQHQECSGWCEFTMQLWSKTPTSDSCSTIVSAYFQFYVYERSRQVLTTMVVTLLATVLGISFVGDVLRSRGYDW